MTAPGFLLYEEPDHIEWYRPAADAGAASQGAGRLEDLPAELPAGHWVWILAATNVLLTEADVPTRQRQKILQAIPFALEERFIADVEQLHFAIGPLRANTPVPVAVVDRNRFAAWQSALAQAGLTPEAAVPETLLLPWLEGTWTLLLTGHRAVIRTGPWSGLGGDADYADLLLREALTEAGERRPQRLIVHHDGQSFDAVQELAAARELAVEAEPIDGPALAWLGRQYRHGSTIDLLQGPFSRKEQLGKLWRPWRATAALFGIWFAVQVGAMTTDYIGLSNEAERLDAQIDAVFRKANPDARNVVDPKLQMQRQLAALQGGSDGGGFLGLLAEAGPALAGTTGLTLRNLRAQRDELELELNLSDLQTLDRLKQQLMQSGELAVEIVSATARDGKVDSRLKIKAAG